MSDGEEGLCHSVRGRRLATQEPQRAPLVQGNVIGLVAFDFVLGFVLAGVVDVSFVIHVRRMHLDDFPADPPSLRIPAYTVTHLESLCHIDPRDVVPRRVEPLDAPNSIWAAGARSPRIRQRAHESNRPRTERFRYRLSAKKQPRAARRWNSNGARLLSVCEESEANARLRVVFATIGLFLLYAALDTNSREAKGFAGTLRLIQHQPYGSLLLGI